MSQRKQILISPKRRMERKQRPQKNSRMAPKRVNSVTSDIFLNKLYLTFCVSTCEVVRWVAMICSSAGCRVCCLLYVLVYIRHVEVIKNILAEKLKNCRKKLQNSSITDCKKATVVPWQLRIPTPTLSPLPQLPTGCGSMTN